MPQASAKLSPELAQAITTYFDGEQSGALLFAGLGIACVTCAGIAWLVSRGRPAKRSWLLISALITLGGIPLLVGGTVYLRTPAQIDALQRSLSSDADQATLDELKRMEHVMREFRIYKWIEKGMIGAGLLAIALAAWRRRLAIALLGVALITNGAALYLLDRAAHARAEIYVEAVAIARLQL